MHRRLPSPRWLHVSAAPHAGSAAVTDTTFRDGQQAPTPPAGLRSTSVVTIRYYPVGVDLSGNGFHKMRYENCGGSDVGGESQCATRQVRRPSRRMAKMSPCLGADPLASSPCDAQERTHGAAARHVDSAAVATTTLQYERQEPVPSSGSKSTWSPWIRYYPWHGNLSVEGFHKMRLGHCGGRERRWSNALFNALGSQVTPTNGQIYPRVCGAPCSPSRAPFRVLERVILHSARPMPPPSPGAGFTSAPWLG